jgi:hypothetical protein
MADFILRKADDSLWHQFKSRAIREGRTLRWVLLELIAYYVDHGLPTAKRR